MRPLTYRTTVYRGAYAAVFVGAYLLLAAYWLSGDDSGSDSSAGVWRLLLGMALACVAGALVGPALHKRLFKRPAPHRSIHKRHEKPQHTQSSK
jgi:hypothetical protein